MDRRIFSRWKQFYYIITILILFVGCSGNKDIKITPDVKRNANQIITFYDKLPQFAKETDDGINLSIEVELIKDSMDKKEQSMLKIYIEKSIKLVNSLKKISDDPLLLKDEDGDRIPDYKDRCLREKEIYNGLKDDDGCPEITGLLNLYPIGNKDKIIIPGDCKVIEKRDGYEELICITGDKKIVFSNGKRYRDFNITVEKDKVVFVRIK